MGVCSALRSEDIVFGTYRSHALYLAKGGDLDKMMAELYGKEWGFAGGKAGSMHLADKESGVMGTSAIVSTTIPQAVGYALAEKMKGNNNTIAVFFGDGATEEGVFWESINFAAVQKLPILFICENNFYAINTPWDKRVVSQNYCERVKSFGLRAQKIKDNDVLKIYSEVYSFLKEKKDIPLFLEIETYRLKEHVGHKEDWDFGYRDKEESEKWVENDQLKKIGEMLDVSEKLLIEKNCESKIKQSFKFAEESPFPSVKSLYEDVYQ